MKTSIAYLSTNTQKDLRKIVKLTLHFIPQCEMIILYGSYARGTFVKYDERVEFGIPTTFMSDYDILVVTSNIDDLNVSRLLDKVDDIYYQNPSYQTPIGFINDDIKKVNSDLSEGRYFYTDVKREGIMLYDSKNYKLARKRKLSYTEIKEQAQEYFNFKFDWANSFLIGKERWMQEKKCNISSYLLQQAAENYFYTMRLVFTLKNSKEHNLANLLNSTRKYSTELRAIFPRNTKEERRLFNLLKAAYIEGRYNPKFFVTKEDMEALHFKVERLRDLTEKVCKTQIEEYARKETI